jgi:hypothetical protein
LPGDTYFLRGEEQSSSVPALPAAYTAESPSQLLFSQFGVALFDDFGRVLFAQFDIATLGGTAAYPAQKHKNVISITSGPPARGYGIIFFDLRGGPVMPNHGHEANVSGTHLLSLALIVVAIAAVVIIAILFRPGGFNVEAQGQGVTIKLAFDDSRVDLSKFIDQLFRQAESGTDADRRLVSSILQAHGFYRIPSLEAAAQLREIKETEATRDFVRAVRSTLYNLEGPFSRPATFLEADDDRMLDAIVDLYDQKPTSPLVTELWRMSLDMKGIFEPRNIKISIREDTSLPSGVAATCTGNIWLNRVGLINLVQPRNDKGHMIGPRIEVPKACVTSLVWLSPTDMSNLVGDETVGSGQELQAILTPLPTNLIPDIQGR